VTPLWYPRMEKTGPKSYGGYAWAKESLLPSSTSPLIISNDDDDDDLVSVSELQYLQGQTLTLPQRQQQPPPRRVPTSGRYRRLYPERSAQTGLRLPPRRRHNRLQGVSRRPRGQIQAQAQALGAVNDIRRSGRARKPKRHN
jgi:hypothetical protein